MTTARRLRRTLFGGFALGLVLTLFVDIAVLAVPIYDMQLYDRVLMSRNMDTLTLLSVACLMGLLLYGILDFLRSACFAVLSRQLAQRLHGPALELSLRRSAAGDRRVGPQIVRDVAELQSFLSSGAIATPLDALCAPVFIALLFVLHPAFGCLALVGISGLIFAGTATELLVQPVLSRAHEQRRGAAHNLSRSLAEIELTDGQGMLPAIVRRWRGRYARALADLSRAGIRAQLLANLARSFRLLLQAAVMALGAVLIIRGDTTPGSLMGANLLLNKCLGPFDHLVESCRSWLVAREAWRRVIDMVRLEPVTATQLPADEGSGLVVNDLHVTTADGVVLLTDVSLTLTPGTLALVAGPNGSGKTTLLRVLAGVVPPTGGRLSLGGAPVTESNALGYLPQSVALMDATIAENIGRLDPDLSRVLAVARQVGVHDRVGRLQRGYETPLVGDGASLSGGMRQRVGLARALYNAPRLIVLDEPDSSLDAEGVDALIGALRSACAGGAIVLVSSHRSALRNAADRVIELRQGRVLSPSLDPARRCSRNS